MVRAESEAPQSSVGTAWVNVKSLSALVVCFLSGSTLAQWPLRAAILARATPAVTIGVSPFSLPPLAPAPTAMASRRAPCPNHGQAAVPSPNLGKIGPPGAPATAGAPKTLALRRERGRGTPHEQSGLLAQAAHCRRCHLADRPRPRRLRPRPRADRRRPA